MLFKNQYNTNRLDLLAKFYSQQSLWCVWGRVCACVSACVHECVSACVRACVYSVCVRAFVEQQCTRFVCWFAYIHFHSRNATITITTIIPLPRAMTAQKCLDAASARIQEAFNNKFKATWLFFATWHRVTFSGGSDKTPVC